MSDPARRSAEAEAPCPTPPRLGISPLVNADQTKTYNSEKPTVLVLAGSRAGVPDLLAHQHAVAHKSLIPIAGKAIIGRVLDAVERALPQSSVIVSTLDFEPLRLEPTVARLSSSGKLKPAPAHSNLADSVLAAARSAVFPIVVTTADNALLTSDAIHALVAEAKSGDADAILVLTTVEAVKAAHPGAKTAYDFRDGSFCNCNLFWVRDEEALHAVEPFRKGGQFRKVRGRVLRTFGLLNLIRYAFRLITLEQMLRHLSRRLNVEVRALVLEDGRLAVDVDDERSLHMAEEIIRRDS